LGVSCHKRTRGWLLLVNDVKEKKILLLLEQLW
jgi:hypothetical protein